MGPGRNGMCLLGASRTLAARMSRRGTAEYITLERPAVPQKKVEGSQVVLWGSAEGTQAGMRNLVAFLG